MLLTPRTIVTWWTLHIIGLLLIPISGIGIPVVMIAVGHGLAIFAGHAGQNTLAHDLWRGVRWSLTLLLYQSGPILLSLLTLALATLPVVGRVILTLLFLMPDEDNLEGAYTEAVAPVINGVSTAAGVIAILMLGLFCVATAAYFHQRDMSAYLRPREIRRASGNRRTLLASAIITAGFTALFTFAAHYWMVVFAFIVGLPLALWQLAISAHQADPTSP